MYEQELGKYFVFDQADLEANRRGQLTDKQKKYLSDDTRYARIVRLGCGVICFALALFIPLASLVGSLVAGQALGLALRNLVPSLALTGILALMGVLILAWMFRQSGVKSAVVLRQASGPINIVAVERRHDLEHPVYIAHELHIGEVAFDVKEEVGSLLRQGEPYTLYYTQNPDGSARLVQSLERLEA